MGTQARFARDRGENRLLSADEVAAILSLSRSSVHRLATSGVLRRVRIGSAVRFRLDDVRLLIDSADAATHQPQSPDRTPEADDA